MRLNLSDKPVDAPNWRAVFGVPMMIGLLSLSGLFSALLFDEIGRYFSWLAVGAPIIIVARLLVKRLLVKRFLGVP
jgi:hypothetical protein